MREPERTVLGFVLAAILATLGALLLPWRTPLSTPLEVAAAAFAYVLALVWLQRTGFLLGWGERSTKVSLEEFAVLVAVLTLPAQAFVAATALGAAAYQLVTRRPLVKASFNMAQYALAGVAAAFAFEMLVDLRVHPIAAAAIAPLAFATVSQGSVALLFARLEERPALDVFRERFLGWTFATSGIGVALGLSVVALWFVHPVAVLAVVPVLVLMSGYGRLSEWADREILVRQRLAEVSGRLVGEAELEPAVQTVLGTCGDIFEAGEVSLVYAPPDEAPRVWQWRHAQGVGSGGIRAEVPGRRGELALFPRPGQRAYGERDRQLLALVAGAIATAMANIEALQTAREGEMRLLHANRELEEFTLWTTHDMREPLRSVATLASILEEDMENMTRDEARELAAKIARGADGLKQRIKALHEFSLIVQQDRPFETISLDAALDAALDGLERRVRESNATIVRPAPLPAVRVQPERMEKVLANLIENSLKYNRRPDPTVEVRAFEHDDHWELSVRDNGPGVDPGYRDRIFRLFQRGPDTGEPGSGTGLAIVKRIVEQHGGRAWVATSGPGADFRFTIAKRARPAAASEPAAPVSAVPPSGRALRRAASQQPSSPQGAEAPSAPAHPRAA